MSIFGPGGGGIGHCLLMDTLYGFPFIRAAPILFPRKIMSFLPDTGNIRANDTKPFRQMIQNPSGK